MHFGLALNSSDMDLWNIDLLDQRYTHLDLLDTDIPSKHFVYHQDVLKTNKCLLGNRVKVSLSQCSHHALYPIVSAVQSITITWFCRPRQKKKLDASSLRNVRLSFFSTNLIRACCWETFNLFFFLVSLIEFINESFITFQK